MVLMKAFKMFEMSFTRRYKLAEYFLILLSKLVNARRPVATQLYRLSYPLRVWLVYTSLGYQGHYGLN